MRLGFIHAVIIGHPGKLLKVSAGNFNTHSKISDGRLESLCTQLAIIGANKEIITKIYRSNTTNQAIDLVNFYGFNQVWNILSEIVSRKCRERVCNEMKIDTFFIDNDGKILGSYIE